ncbi:ankyrin repeat domain-containing protein [Larkinella rosea]|uniref:Ankyrin repeat domain-containing protein n=1 Tax=Larkinella rosea TaxID=2025312 RepID=A0A3P1BTI8_9BACT|nr:ankyrin repeat domain-containing protein [Larkinella rosea]RRB04428.1 ankyrin repeat domain-containing protein [Larkinella rosea]
MKIISITNWVLIGIYGLLTLYTLLGIGRSGNDAAGRGMESGLVFFAVLVLAGLIVLNIIPYKAAKITALIILGLPAIIGLSIAIGNYFELQKQRRNAAASEDGSAYFQDASRQQIAAVIAAGDVAQLKTLLEKPLPSLNETGSQSKTLLDFAAETATRSDKPQQIIQCMDVLLEHGATFQIADSAHVPTPFQVCETGSADLLAWFLNKGVDPNWVPRDGSPILFKVMDLDVERLEKVKVLLDHGANPNAPAGSHEYTIRPFTSPLMYTAQRQSWAIAELLLERGADPNYRTPAGDDLKKVLAEFEKPYEGPETMPVVYLNFKKKLEAKSGKKF